jgi:hypothetical protein
MNNTPWIPYTPDSLPKEEGYYLTCRRFSDYPYELAFDVLYFGQDSYFFYATAGVVAYMEIPLVPQEFKLAA